MIKQDYLAEAHSHHPHRIRADKLDSAERKIFDALKAGDKVEKGAHAAKIERRVYTKRIRWRDELEKLPGGRKRVKELLDRLPKAKTVEYLVFE